MAFPTASTTPSSNLVTVTSIPDLLSLSPILTTPSSARLTALYSFTSKQRDTNPAGYEANVKWWIQVLEEGLREGLFGGAGVGGGGAKAEGDRLSLKVNQESLGRALEVPGMGRPKGIGGVLASATRISPPNLIPAVQFLSSLTPIHQEPSLASRFVARPIFWALAKVNPISYVLSSAEESSESEEESWKRLKSAGGEFVWVPLVQQAADNFIAHLTSNPPVTNTARLLTTSLFQSLYGTICLPSRIRTSGTTPSIPPLSLSLSDCKLLLKYLVRDRKFLLSDLSGEVFKIPESGNVISTGTGTGVNQKQVTEADRGTVQVLMTLTKLERQIAQTEKEILSAKNKAAHYLHLNQKPTALSYLRSKKQLEQELQKRIGAAEQLKTIIRSIDGAHGDIEIMAAYSLSSSALTSILSHPSLQRSHLDSTLESLSDIMADAQEIEEAIQIGGQIALEAGGVQPPEEDDLEKELAALVLDTKQEEVEKEVEAKKSQAEKPAAPAQMSKPTLLDVNEGRQSNSGTAGSTSARATTSLNTNTTKSWETIHHESEQRKQEEAERALMERQKMEEKKAAAAMMAG